MRFKKNPNAAIVSAFLLLPTVCLAQPPARQALSPAAQQTAQIIGIEPLLAKLTDTSPRGAAVLTLEQLSLHQQITEAVMGASLDVDSVMDRIAYEHAQIVELQNILLARKQRAIGTTNLATLALSTGLGAVGGILQYGEATKDIGNAIGLAAGGLSTLLSFRGFRQQHSEGRPAWVFPSMLTPFFSNPPETVLYPDDVWTYLNTPPSDAVMRGNRRERLLSEWRKDGRFGAVDSPQAKSRIALLTSTDAADKKLDLDLLSERAAMLADVHEQVSTMKRALGEILRQIRGPR